jgi:hypothetical protein
VKVLAWGWLSAVGDPDSILAIAMIEEEEKEKERIVAFREGQFFSLKIER